MVFAIVCAIIAVVIAVCAIVMANKNMGGSDSGSSNQDAPTVDEGRKICVVRGTAWVTSTQITVYHKPYNEGG